LRLGHHVQRQLGRCTQFPNRLELDETRNEQPRRARRGVGARPRARLCQRVRKRDATAKEQVGARVDEQCDAARLGGGADRGDAPALRVDRVESLALHDPVLEVDADDAGIDQSCHVRGDGVGRLGVAALDIHADRQVDRPDDARQDRLGQRRGIDSPSGYPWAAATAQLVVAMAGARPWRWPSRCRSPRR
jgi:hypothetical protein